MTLTVSSCSSEYAVGVLSVSAVHVVGFVGL